MSAKGPINTSSVLISSSSRICEGVGNKGVPHHTIVFPKNVTLICKHTHTHVPMPLPRYSRRTQRAHTPHTPATNIHSQKRVSLEEVRAKKKTQHPPAHFPYARQLFPNFTTLTHMPKGNRKGTTQRRVQKSYLLVALVLELHKSRQHIT